MNQKVRDMLEQIYDIFTDKFKDRVVAWDYFIEFLAVDNCGSLLFQLDHKLEWFVKDIEFSSAVLRIYNPDLLRADYYDHLGEMYLEKVVSQGKNKNTLGLISIRDAADKVKSVLSHTDKQIKIMDPSAGTGRLLMAAFKQAPNALLFGIESDLRLYRIAFTNFVILNIPVYLLHADSSIHESDLSTKKGKHNWKYANKWYSYIDQLQLIKNVDLSKAHQNKKPSLILIEK